MNIEWNAHVKVNEATIKSKTVGLGWGVPDAAERDRNYEAHITVTLPIQANGSVGKQAPNETVVIAKSSGLSFGNGIIEADVTYHVSPKNGATGSRVDINVAETSGFKPPVAGPLPGGTGTGLIGEDITVRVRIPGPA